MSALRTVRRPKRAPETYSAEARRAIRETTERIARDMRKQHWYKIHSQAENLSIIFAESIARGDRKVINKVMVQRLCELVEAAHKVAEEKRFLPSVHRIWGELRILAAVVAYAEKYLMANRWKLQPHGQK